MVADDAAAADAAADDEDEYYVLFHCSYNYYCHHELCQLCCYRFDDITLFVVIETAVAHLSQRCRAYISSLYLHAFPLSLCFMFAGPSRSKSSLGLGLSTSILFDPSSHNIKQHGR